MALNKDILLENGLKVQNAYIRINTISGYKDRLDISVNSYVSQESFNSGQGYLEQKMYHFVPNVSDES